MGTMRSIEGLVPTVERKGQYPLSDVAVTVEDLDVFKANRAASMDEWCHCFPTIDFISEPSLFRPLTTIPVPGDVPSKSF